MSFQGSTFFNVRSYFATLPDQSLVTFRPVSHKVFTIQSSKFAVFFVKCDSYKIFKELCKSETMKKKGKKLDDFHMDYYSA